MRKHHNKLFYGVYTHKTIFKMPWAHGLYPTTDENLLKYVKGQVSLLGKYNMEMANLAGFIMENRHNMKFRVQKDQTLFYSNFETARDILVRYWDYFIDVKSVNLTHIDKIKKNIIICKRYPHNAYQYQIYLKKDIHRILDENEKDSFAQFCFANKSGIKITNKFINDYLTGKNQYCWHGYFFVKEEKFLSVLYILIEKAIDKVYKYIKI